MDKRPEEKHQLAANLVRKEDTPMPVPPQQFDIFEDDDEFEEFEEEGMKHFNALTEVSINLVVSHNIRMGKDCRRSKSIEDVER